MKLLNSHKGAEIKTTTLANLRELRACKDSYDTLAAHVGEDFTGEISLDTALEVLPLEDCVWALRTIEGGAAIAVEFAIRVAYPFGSVEWKLWADKWLSGEDRSEESAKAAADATAYASAYAAAYAIDAACAAATARAAAAAAAAAYAAIDALIEDAHATTYTAAYATANATANAAEDRPAELARQTVILKELLK